MISFRPRSAQEARELVERYKLVPLDGKPGRFRFPICRGALGCLHPAHRLPNFSGQAFHAAEVLDLWAGSDPFRTWRWAASLPRRSVRIPRPATMFDREPSFPPLPVWCE